MKISTMYAFRSFLVILVLSCVGILPAHAQTQERNFGPEIQYAPEQRFAVPVSKATGLNGAKNVVIKEMSLSSVPDFIRIQAETLSETCTKDIKNAKLIKFYRYTSDATREARVSANYLADLQGLAIKPQQACVLGNACSVDGCLLVGYNSTGYEKWGQNFTFRQKSWTYKNVEDKKNNAILTIFELTAKCKKTAKGEEDQDKNDEGCVSKRAWIESGFVDYKNGSLLDNAAPFAEDTGDITPQAEPEAPDVAEPVAPPASEEAPAPAQPAPEVQ